MRDRASDRGIEPAVLTGSRAALVGLVALFAALRPAAVRVPMETQAAVSFAGMVALNLPRGYEHFASPRRRASRVGERPATSVPRDGSRIDGHRQ